MPGGNGGLGGLGGPAGSTGPQWFRISNTGSVAFSCQFSLTDFYSSYNGINVLDCTNNCLSTSGCTHITFDTSLSKCYIYLGLINQSMATYSLAFNTLCLIFGKLLLFFYYFDLKLRYSFYFNKYRFSINLI